MNKIQVKVLAEGHTDPCGNACSAGMMLFLARLTQRGHKINTMEDLLDLYNKSTSTDFADKRSLEIIRSITQLPHGTIKRFTPITVAIVGASRRFLAQARTHQVGMTFVSASLQYSDYSGSSDFVVPYELIQADHNAFKEHGGQGAMLSDIYLESCSESMYVYKSLAEECGNDAAGYAAPQGLRNILIIQGNHESWAHFIRTRACNRNTNETQYVAMKIWEELLNTSDGKELFKWLGPDCVYGKCREGSMCCGEPLHNRSVDTVQDTIKDKWPLLFGGCHENT